MRVAGARRARLVIVPARAAGPSGQSWQLSLLVDTGAARTCLTPAAAALLGLDLSRPLGHVRLSGVGSVTAPIVAVDTLRIGALIAHNLPAAVLTLPRFLRIDGLLGMDFCDALGITSLTLELATATLVLR